MRGRVGGLLGCAALLAGCSVVMGPPDPPPPPRQPEPPPDVRQLIKSSGDTLFDPTTQPKDIALSNVRRFSTAAGLQDGFCLRARVVNRQGHDLGNVVYVVIVTGGRLVERRRALPADQCDREQYQPL